MIIEIGTIVFLVTAVVCLTINMIHKRNKKVEVMKEAIRNGYGVDATL